MLTTTSSVKIRLTDACKNKKTHRSTKWRYGRNESQEVTLRKINSEERIGLTVSYSSGNGSGSGSDDADTCTEVYISDIMENSVAARDGRLRQGDQILQVCNCRASQRIVYIFKH